MMALRSLSLMAIVDVSSLRHGRDGHRTPRLPPCSLRATSRPRHARRARLRLRAAPRGSGRSVALRCARRPRVRVGDGQTDASGGGSGLRMVPSTSMSENSVIPINQIERQHGVVRSFSAMRKKYADALAATRAAPPQRKTVGQVGALRIASARIANPRTSKNPCRTA